MRDTLGTEMSMPVGAQAGRSIYVSNNSPRGVWWPCAWSVFELRLLIVRQEGE
ncbi:hypothetical protein GCM10010278_00930 [Streptomyces melanogenes]|uniref:Uncharacterized protein n=1 Tax=Streptomyces crystallinus TaxID=68191 RepID=A0ABP3QWM2_9ACTN|nr:hypothetical protein GCM10010278_00930 [Streptomyces melanogenes]